MSRIPDERISVQNARANSAATAARLSPSTALLVRTARPTLGPGAALAPLAQSIGDWERFLDQAHRHCTLPMLHRHLRTLPSGALPDGSAELLARQAKATALNNMQRSAELVRLVGLLEDQGITVIAYKGPVLAMLLYGDVALRQFGDLDLLVCGDDVRRAGEALEAAGYRATRPDALAIDGPLPGEGQLMYLHEHPRCAVELHWRVVQRHLRVAFEFDDLASRSVSITIGGRAIRTLAPDDLLLVLAVHHTKHRWERLQWIAEFAELVERREEIGLDLDMAFDRARDLGIERMLRLGLRLGVDLWALELPSWCRGDLAADPEIGALAREVYRALEEREGRLSQVGDRVAFQRRARDRSRDRFAMGAGRLFEPSLEDRSVVRLPRFLYPLYYVIRPFRLIFSRLFGRD